MKYLRISLLVVAALAVLGVAGWYFVGWCLNKAFQSGGWPTLLLSFVSSFVTGMWVPHPSRVSKGGKQGSRMQPPSLALLIGFPATG